MNFRTVILAAVAGGASISSIAPIHAALLSTDSAAMAGFKGSQVFSASNGFQSFASSVEFAVYAPGSFQTSSALGSPTDPSGGSQYVYAYRITNTGTVPQLGINELSVGLDGVTNSANIGVISGGGFGANPDTSSIIAGLPSSAHWVYNLGVPSSQSGNVLLFTSPKSPQLFNSSILAGALSSQHLLPSPIPEPTSVMVLSGLSLLAMGIGRPNRNKIN